MSVQSSGFLTIKQVLKLQAECARYIREASERFLHLWEESYRKRLYFLKKLEAKMTPRGEVKKEGEQKSEPAKEEVRRQEEIRGHPPASLP